MKNSFYEFRSLTLAALLILISGVAMAKGGFIDLYPASFDSDSDEITNSWWPQAAGDRFIYFEEEECVLGVVDVTPDGGLFRAVVNGVKVREVLDREFVDDDDECDGDITNPLDPEWKLLESTYDWYAQDDAGNVWYFGEYTVATDHDDCEHSISDTEGPFFLEGCLDGAWESGYDVWEEVVDEEIIEGVIMLADPTKSDKGVFYFQEFWEDEATDMGKILNFKPVETLIYGDQENCLMTKEWAPLDPGGIEHKYYCEGFGLVLIEGNAGGPTVFEELVFGPTP